MISIPLPFVVALLIGLLVIQVVAQERAGRGRLIAFLSAAIVLMVIVGLRWSVDARIFRALQPVAAALLPATAWLCFADLGGRVRSVPWPHALPALLVLVLPALWPPAMSVVDLLLAALFFGYGARLMGQGLAGPDGIAGARLGEAQSTARAAALAGALLVFSGLVDLAVALDFGLGGGTHAARIVSAANMLTLPPIALAAMAMARGTPEPEPEALPSTAGSAHTPVDAVRDDAGVLAAVERLLAEQRLYRDPDLTLARLARRVGCPARDVSRAINAERGCNVSQFVNEWRIREAMDRLAQTERPVTEVMFDCGFQTKSNFNREFRRIAGTSPSDWRRSAREGAVSAPQTPRGGS